MRAGTHLRAATWRDIPAMADLERAAFPEDPWDEASLWSELARRPRRSYLVAHDPRTSDLVGYAGLDLGGDVADVMTLAVDPRARGRGVGTLLLDELHHRARAAGAASVMLEVRSGNDVARRLYASRGYALVRTRRRYYRSGEDALALRKELSADG
ncbi:ribosomal protein S18-alanine N-acetyltransferase [Serinicoccus kebangsaanensis]|uniref:ribosomal protein S18-alanine N-acetyltransferase n=1 Tax=Serinicoccus kebangsaanensis TaxID=2602069 RepID=UPI00124D1A1B|nr:ribosomal protein S18-alanine N-acetyltransferase [Serinicoccus kebangsaanensis]